jgi:hypothetical protein
MSQDAYGEFPISCCPEIPLSLP